MRAVISDDRSAGVCERIVAGWDEPAKVIPTSAAHGQALTLDMLMQAEPAKLAHALARGAARLHVLLGLDRAPEARGAHARAVRGEAEYYDWMGIGPEDRIFCTIPLFHTYGMGCCMFAATRTGATLVILEDPNPFLLRRQRAMELLETEGVTIYPGVPFNFRLMAEAPGVGRPVVDPAGLLRRHRAAAARSSTPSSTSSACRSASSTAAPRRAR